MGPAFNRMWASSIVSNLSDGILIAAAPLLAISLTDSTVLISAIGASVMLPWLLFAIPIGVLVDRVDRRYILAGANATRSAVVGVLALLIATDHVTIYWLLVASFVIGVCEVAADTTAQSLIPQILEEKNFEKGNSRLQISETVIQGFVGAPLSGFIYAIAIALPFFINSLGLAVASLLALSIPIKYLQDVRKVDVEKEKKKFVADMKFGIKYLFNEKVLRRLVVTTASIGVCYSMGMATVVLFIIKELELPKQLFGVILTIQGIGAITGAFMAPRLSKKFGRSRVMTVGITSSSLVLLLQGFSPNIYVYVGLANPWRFCRFTMEHLVDGYLSNSYSYRALWTHPRNPPNFGLGDDADRIIDGRGSCPLQPSLADVCGWGYSHDSCLFIYWLPSQYCRDSQALEIAQISPRLH